MAKDYEEMVQELEDAGVPWRIHYAIGAGTTEHHPFKHGSASFSDFIRVMPGIRGLDEEHYTLCLSAIRKLVLAQRPNGCNCYGRGLVYLRHLAFGRSESVFAETSELLSEALVARTTLPPRHDPHRQFPFQEQFGDMLAALGIEEIEGYEPIPKGP